MPKRAIVALLIASAACAGDDSQPTAASSESCVRVGLDEGADLAAGTWRRMTAPHGVGRNGLLFQVDDVLDTCDAIVSVAHDPGPGGKAVSPGPGQIMWSANGSTWRSHMMSDDAYFRSIAFGNGAWVAVGGAMGGGAIAVSTDADASSWRQVFQHTEMFISVAFGAGKFVAVTQRGLALSPDGANWHWVGQPSVQALYFDVAYGAGRFVVAGVGATLHSTDGEHWDLTGCGPSGCRVVQPPTGPGSSQIALQEVHFTAGAFFAFGASGNLRSTDGINFLPYEGERVPDAAVGGKLLSLIPNNGNAMSELSASSDGGATWTVLPLGETIATADCSVSLCIAVNQNILVYDP